MSGDRATLPDGTTFPFWTDETDYDRTYHVAREHPDASDDNPGTSDAPFETIGRAADLLEPGEKVVVHEGVYRECVRPARGGDGPDRMVAYEAAPGEDVVVRGSESWDPDVRPTESWDVGAESTDATVWTASFPAEWFVGYNPFGTRNVPSADQFYVGPAADGKFTEGEQERFMLRRGAVFVDGEPLEQVFYPRDVGERPGRFWVEDPGLRIHFRMPEGVDPDDADFEVTAREQVFAPREKGLGYVRVSGFRFEHAADGVPIPQRAAVSANLGHHWVVEDNDVRWANGCGIDVGYSSWHRTEVEDDESWRPTDRPERPPDSGHHVISGNHVAHCGACGIAAMANNQYTLVEDNVVEHVGDRNLERIWETAGLKFHLGDGLLVRSNVFRHVRHASGIWLDYMNENSRVTGNVIADVESIRGGIYHEVNHHPALIDHNVVWNVRGDDPGDEFVDEPHGHGIHVDTGDNAVVAHNLVGRVRDGFAIEMGLLQADRKVRGRVGLCSGHTVANNVVLDSPLRVDLGRLADNEVDGNLYDVTDDAMSLCVATPEPAQWLDLETWQSYHGLDRNGGQTAVDAAFDPEALTLDLDVDEVPSSVPVDGLPDAPDTPGPTALSAETERYTFH